MTLEQIDALEAWFCALLTAHTENKGDIWRGEVSTNWFNKGPNVTGISEAPRYVQSFKDEVLKEFGL